jgi:hypothetical protein
MQTGINKDADLKITLKLTLASLRYPPAYMPSPPTIQPHKLRIPYQVALVFLSAMVLNIGIIFVSLKALVTA